ncbi:MAG: hypothetical protein RQ756_06160, partial [Flavobacteriaceae bacterium]|nr:hypothetical protein [Flavobacteriaceae bacterium]
MGMWYKCLLYVLVSAFGGSTVAQHKITMQVIADLENKSLHIEQSINYHNTSSDVLNKIVLLDWAHAFSDKRSPLGIKFAELYRNAFHFASMDKRGATLLEEAKVSSGFATFLRRNDTPDIIDVNLIEPLMPGDKIKLQLRYTVLLPDDTFTRFGVNTELEAQLRYWFIYPANYANAEWIAYSHKNLDDFPLQNIDYDISIDLPFYYEVYTALNQKDSLMFNTKRHFLKGKNRGALELYFSLNNEFRNYQINELNIIT